ncbi:hypothetical protein [Novosphingobium sp. AAP1]|uniref:hypothetical protein n=1 Tax=Novosphingobium sp. AAP1 TaxID=1523413 RepID=UPI0018D03AA8|nr:hypothetical protein [Novosphingobium sp. AAP1]
MEVRVAIERIHLRKLLKILFLPPAGRQSEVRKDIREDISREAGHEGSGGDFYGPFWADAKRHVFGQADLSDLTESRIRANEGRKNLYPQLRDGFLLWWNERRRWTNEPFEAGRQLKAQFSFPGLDAVVKVDNVLVVRDGRGEEHAVYPYFAPNPAMSDAAARLGLWLLIEALPHVPAGEIRILDVIRGTTYSIDRNPLRGDEEAEFRRRYRDLLNLRDNLLPDYER